MNKLLFAAIAGFLFLNLQLFSQDHVFKPFKVDFGLTCDIPTDDNAGTGVGIYIEPRYGASEKLTIGLKLQNDFLGAGDIEINYISVKISSTRIFSLLITGDYYFSTENVRPFVGLGLGMYKKYIYGVSTGITGVDIGSVSDTNFGFEPRIGININHFRIAGLYNYTGKGISDYVGIQFGFEFGGGRINK
ncbi:MAG: hypothetical protein JXJ22_14685 [Bacteroidales bacterium]|nr:hypothetical protein [Bacteroidales bacterium]